MAGINFFACQINIGLYSPMWCSSVTAGLPVLKHPSQPVEFCSTDCAVYTTLEPI